MKHKSTLSMASAIISSLLLLPGCQKLQEALKAHTVDPATSCKIKTFIYFEVPAQDTVVFYYNDLGNPIAGIWSQSKPHSNYYFRYDKHNRLQDWIAAYPSGTGVFWNRYFYADEKTQNSFFDSIYPDPSEIDKYPPPSVGNVQWDNFEYDSLNRVSKVIFSSRESVASTYDAKGDLILNGPQYSGPDDKVDFNRTSKVFQFLDRDYSVNNTFIASKYNFLGLPEQVSIPFSGEGSQGFLGISYITGNFEYDCNEISGHKGAL
jgi:hypothetical protein